MIPPDSELIARTVVSDDRPAFGELVQRHQSSVRNFLRHLNGGDAALADDLAQETFLQAYRGLARYRGDANFTTWLLGIAHNYHRNARRRRGLATETLPDTAVDPDSLAATRSVDLRQDVDAALRRLSAEEQTAVHLFYQQGLTHPEISDVVGWPLGTVKTHIARAKEKLRLQLAQWNPQT